MRTDGSLEVGQSRVKTQIEAVEFGDKRLNERFVVSTQHQLMAPDESYPEMFGDSEYLEGFYRWTNNEKVTMQKAMDPQFEDAAERCRDEDEIFVIHDTTDFALGGEDRREGMGRINAENQGFLAHFSLATKTDASREPLGLLASQVWTRRPEEGPDPYDVEEMWEEFEDKESEKWKRGIERSEQRLDEEAAAPIHVMDSGSDDYELWASLDASNQRWIGRARYRNRRLKRSAEWSVQGEEAPKLEDAIEQAEPLTERTIWLSSRGRKGRPGAALEKHPPREERQAEIEIRTNQIDIKRPASVSPELPDHLSLHLVVAIEPNPPEGKEPVEWVIVTSEAVEQAEQAERVVDGYQTRWTIEELNKGIKTGCSYEERQLESSHAMLNALAMTMPVAIELLRLRTLSQFAPAEPADRILSSIQEQILVDHRKTDYELGASVQEGLRAVAQLGGFLSHNDVPGWLTMMRGMKKLHTLTNGYRIGSESSEDHEETSGTTPGSV